MNIFEGEGKKGGGGGGGIMQLGCWNSRKKKENRLLFLVVREKHDAFVC